MFPTATLENMYEYENISHNFHLVPPFGSFVQYLEIVVVYALCVVQLMC